MNDLTKNSLNAFLNKQDFKTGNTEVKFVGEDGVVYCTMYMFGQEVAYYDISDADPIIHIEDYDMETDHQIAQFIQRIKPLFRIFFKKWGDYHFSLKASDEWCRKWGGSVNMTRSTAIDNLKTNTKKAKDKQNDQVAA